MSNHYYFHLQHFNGDVWTTPPAFDDPTDRVAQGVLTWFDDKDTTIFRLFLRDDALFPLRREMPPEFDITEFYRRWYRRPGESDADVLDSWHSDFQVVYQGWIGFDDLGLDEWTETEVLVLKAVRSEIAPLFKDGDQPFPRDVLLNLGWSVHDVDELANTSCYAFDNQFSFKGYSLTEEPARGWHNPRKRPNDLSQVSWKTTLADFMGDWRMEAFRRARTVGPDTHLRILCLFC